MDLKQQLAIWKRTDYLLKNIPFTPKLCDLLIDFDLFTAEMMAKVQMSKYNVEKTLMIIKLLGEHGTDVYDKFLAALAECNLQHVVNELKRTEKSIKFGEIHPPVFSYFQDMTEFLRCNWHIAVRLGEADKRVIQSFIDGKLAVQSLTTKEKLDGLDKECGRLRQLIEQQNRELAKQQRQTEETQALLISTREELTDSKSQYNHLAEISKSDHNDSLLYRQLRLEANRIEALVRMESQRLKLNNSNSPSRQSTRNSQHSADRPSQGSSDDGSRLIRIAWLQAALRLHTDKMFSLIAYKERVEQMADSMTSNDKRSAMNSLVEAVGMKNTMEMRTLAAEIGYESHKLTDQINEEQLLINKIHAEIDEINASMDDLTATHHHQQQQQPLHTLSLQDESGLDAKVRGLFADIQRTNAERTAFLEAAHSATVADMKSTADSELNQANNVIAGLKLRLRSKMQEVHRRDVVLWKLKRQLGVISRYHARNMNAQVSVDECRKIVRDIMRDARELLTIIDKWETELQQDNEEEQEKGDEIVEQEKQHKKKTRHVLDNQLFRHIADKLINDVTGTSSHQQEQDDHQLQPISLAIWRRLGALLDLTPNRLDMVELDAAAALSAVQAAIDAGLAPADRLDIPGYAMLRVWRDEEAGQPRALHDALKTLGYDDLAGLVQVMAGLDPTVANGNELKTSASGGAIATVATAAGDSNKEQQKAPSIGNVRPRLQPTKTLAQTLRAR